ncbi:DUF6624 domain-containing protein [Chryseobacterium sp. PTM-20240506]|uniref:DUF6624 domain-containing protein n=1 Tax=unclassified Chryseobacterium TaxID=2593645 RepID=UPI0023581F36|nr:DUF6624 domain-containing protein [Chryseobacterium sp. B21-037]MDC8103415.1 hypothetical protein [Chryseobacterium sp. B21-037]
MSHNHFAERIIELKNEDLELRDQLIKRGELGEGYHKEMEQLHNRNAKKLNDIMDIIGYPGIDKVGKEASEAAWLIIQHAIGQPELMRKCVRLLKDAVDEQKADPKNLAYLSDRIAVFEGKPQLYGTQFDWNENGEMVPNFIDNITKVNERRKSVGLNTLEEQTAIIREQVKRENQSPPEDFSKRKNELEIWKKKVGWIK